MNIKSYPQVAIAKINNSSIIKIWKSYGEK